MHITIKDAFGADVGEADVTWAPVKNPETLAEEIAAIFEPVILVPLPTRNARLAWQLKVVP